MATLERFETPQKKMEIVPDMHDSQSNHTVKNVIYMLLNEDRKTTRLL